MSETAKPTKTTFELKKIYLKDTSFESPNAPGVFTGAAVNPQIKMQVGVSHSHIDGVLYNAILTITITAELEESTLFLVEVQQAGIFEISGMPEEKLTPVLEIGCPATLLPFAREAVADLVQKGGFPQLLIAPINFEGLYKKKRDQLQQAQTEAASSGATH